MDKLEEMARERQEAHRRLLSLGSKVYAAFVEMERKAFAEGALPKKDKELIALGISVSINCESCMQWHIEQAVTSGASLAEIVEAIGVAIEMGGGPATVSARFALKVLAALFPDEPGMRAPE
jgi:AhpD family alkylhydroperoxidase